MVTQQPWSGSGGPPAPVEWLPALDIPAPEHQNRLTVFFRALLLIPHFIVLFVLSIVAFFATVAGWFAALVLGRLPDPIAEFLTHYLGFPLGSKLDGVVTKVAGKRKKDAEKGSGEDKKANVNAALNMHSGSKLDEQ